MPAKDARDREINVMEDNAEITGGVADPVHWLCYLILRRIDKMKLITIHKNVESGQCKGALCRIQIMTTAIFLFAGMRLWFKSGFAGSQIGVFAPNGYKNNRYKFTKFYFRPWFAPDVPVSQLPSWYKKTMKIISFG